MSNRSRTVAVSAGLACMLAALTSNPAARAEAVKPQVVYYKRTFGQIAQIFDFKVLKLALAKSGRSYDLEPTPLGHLSEQQGVQAVLAGEKLDVVWLGVTPTYDEQLSPVRIPIDRGIKGCRIFLIDGARQAEFSRIKSLADLRKMTALQGPAWPDTPILRNAGLSVSTGGFDHLFHMMLARRGDYVPRDLPEAFRDQARFSKSEPGLTVEKTLLLHYTLTDMFYVRRSNQQLHDDLYRGFVAALKDGSYDALFKADPEIHLALKLAHLKSRRVIEIDNPNMPRTGDLADPQFWFKP